ncbi:MAG TPA: hypothetical protein VD999_02630 [Vitreimonas sp.]|nr:hypothetical protein [Vitreimonas sp.]
MNLLQTQLTGLRRKQHLLYLMLFTFATILVWVVISLLSSQNKTKISPQLLLLAKPLTPTINRQVLDRLEQKRVYTAQELARFPIYTLIITKEGDARVTTLQEADVILSQPASPSTVRPSPSPSPSPVSGSEGIIQI